MGGIDNQPIVFNIQFTPYSLPKNATETEIATHAEEHSFYDMTGGKNVFSYITTEGKRTGKKTALEYLQKSTGVFNQKGILPQATVDEMKARLKENKGHIHHGFISFNEENSHKIDTPEKCIAFVKSTFGSFFKAAHISEKNIDLMCALHLDRPHHLHIHFVFWEKEPKYKDGRGGLKYRSRGFIDKAAIDNMFVRSGIFVSDDKDLLHKTRKEAILRLRGMAAINVAMASEDEIKKEIIALAKDLPKDKNLYYNSKAAEPFRERVDKIVKMLLSYDAKARKADLKFYRELEKRKQVIKNICSQPYAFSDKNIAEEKIRQNLPKYHFKIDDGNIKIVEEIEADYKRRQGNLVINLAKFIKPELYERKPYKKYRANDNSLKKKLDMSRKKVNRLMKNFFKAFALESRLLERDFTNRLREIEREIKDEQEGKKKDQTQSEEGYYKS